MGYQFRRGILVPSKRSLTPPQDFIGSGHPDDAIGVDGNTYTRNDRNGWVYTKQSGVWRLTSVGTGAPDIFGASNVWYYSSPYVSFTGQRGDVQTNGRFWSTWGGVSALGTTPSNANGSDGTPNILQIADPINGGLKKMLWMRFLEADADSGGTGASRTMKRYIADALNAWNDSNENRITLRLRTQYWFSFSVSIPTDLHTYFNTTKPNARSVLWQIHDNSLGTLSPNFEVLLSGRTDTAYGKPSGNVGICFAIRGNPDPRIVAGSGAGTNGTTTTFGQMEVAAPNTIVHFLIGARLGYQASDNPRTEVYTAVDGGAFTKRVDSTAINAFNADSGGPDYDHYISFGQYMWANVDPGASFINHWKDMCVSVGGHTLSTDDLEDAQRFLQVR